MQNAPKSTQIQEVIKDQVQPIQVQVTGTLAVVFGLLIAVFIKDFLNPWIKRQTVKISFNRQQDQEIDQILTVLLTLTTADRVILTRFTNGIYTIDGASIKGCVVTHEVVQIGIEKVEGLINERISNYSSSIIKSFTHEPWRSRITSDIKDVAYRAFLEQLNVRFSINLFLTANDLPLGFLSFHWRSPNSRMDFEAVSQNEIRGYADSIISRLMSNQNVITKFINTLPKP